MHPSTPLWLLIAVLPCSAVTAQDELEFGAKAAVERPRAGIDERDATAAASEVDLDSHPLREADADTVLRDAEGLTPQRLGGAGARSSVSIRGTATAHTELLVDGLPLSGPISGGPDLSTLRLEAFDRIHVYRGSAPSWITLGAIGGTINLLPHGEGKTEAKLQLGGGSYGERRSAARVSLSGGGWDWSSHVFLRSHSGDYNFTFDPTPFAPGDESTRTRQNADLLEGQVLLAARMRDGDHGVRVVGLGYERTGGVPGPVAQPTSFTHRRLQLGHLALGYSFQPHNDTRLEAALGLGHRRQVFSDPYAEVALAPRQSDDAQTSLSSHLSAEQRWLPWLVGTASLRFSHFQFAPHDSLRRTQVPDSEQNRVDVALEPAIETRLAGMRFDIRPQLRISYQQASLRDLETSAPEANSEQWVPGFRLAAGLEPMPGVYISASAAHLMRTPNVSELFGDRAFLKGNANLDAERATEFDLGIRSEASGSNWRGHISLRAYANFVQDLIRYSINSQYQAVPRNTDRARVVGAELGAQASVSNLSNITVATGWLRAVNPDAQNLPLRPPFHLYARIEGPEFMWGVVSGRSYVDFYYLSANYLDDANLVELPARSLLGAGVRATVTSHTELVFRIENILDQQRQDLVGFPLPGRSFTLLLSGKLAP